MTTLMGLELSGRAVLAVGGGAVSERRVRRFLREGARVRLVAPVLTDGLGHLVDSGAIEWSPRGFHPDDVADVWFVHTATGDADTDAQVVAECEKRRLWCVNAGSAAHGNARMTAQVRSDDLLVGVVSDGGVDPRRSIAVREAIGDLLAAGALPTRRHRSRAVGTVHLVGGGPGPVDLLTVRARRLLATADVIVHDRLGPTSVLEEVSPDVELIDVGKRPGHHTVPQEGINAILVERARRGLTVVRLKGGDPFVFGRGGEEMRDCLRAGVPVEVVPGISSALAVPQAAGIPVTHRGVSGAVLVVNGQDALSPATAAALRAPGTTVVVLMGVGVLPRLAGEALLAGAPADRPVAFIERGHTPAQRVIRTSLGAAARTAHENALSNPAVIVIGDVARSDLLLDDRPAELPREALPAGGGR